MRNNMLVELEQIIDRLPDRTITYEYSSGVRVTLWHDNMWHGEIADSNKSEECRTATFQEIENNLLRTHLDDQSLQQLLDEAQSQLVSRS